MNAITIEKRENIVNIMSQNEEFIIVGLTGRIGSGCSEAAQVFGSTFQELELPWIQPGAYGFKGDSERDRRILQRYAGAHWLKFDIIKTRTIISTFLLENLDKLSEHLGQNNLKDELHKTLLEKVDKFTPYLFTLNKSDDTSEEKLNDMLFRKLKFLTDNNNNLFNSLKKDFLELAKSIENENMENGLLLCCTNACNALGELYEYVDKNNCMSERSKYLTEIEEILGEISKIAENEIIKNKTNFWGEISKINKFLDENSLDKSLGENDNEKLERFKRFVFAHNIMPDLGDALHDYIVSKGISFTKLFQKFGNSIRKYGNIKFENDNNGDDNNLKGAPDVFEIPRKIVQFIKVLRHPFSENRCRPVRIVIDSIKNVFEATYLRQRYSSFYLFAISADEEIRKNRLLNNPQKRLTMRDIQFIDWNEYSSEGCKIYQKGKNKKDGIEYEFYKHITEHGINGEIKNDEKKLFLHDAVREYAYENKLQQFYLQDVAASIENADVFISNNHNDGIPKNIDLRWEIVRNVCLIMFPGLVMPTPIERCMQIAFAAKCNSGCLSRQVGAVVTDKEYNILSIGWNDVPCGDISCSQKNLVDLCKWEDKTAYSKYELENREFRERISKFNYRNGNLSRLLRGLPLRYCFKDIHMEGKNPMRSRSMHAEEKALATCSNECEGGFLFTTSSPCEMCSKNAKNHKIKKIFYIELYPGISESQYSTSGDPSNVAKHILFTGAIGRAYMQMYTPIMPQKDILDLLGIYNECWPGK